MGNLRDLLKISNKSIETINRYLLDDNNSLINALLEIVDKHGGPKEINKKAKEARNLNTMLQKLGKINPNHVQDLEWLIRKRDNQEFISIPEYRRSLLGDKIDSMKYNDSFAVTLEFSAVQYWEFFIDLVKQSLDKKLLMPGRFIKVRNMKEQENDGDLIAFQAAYDIIGSTYVETLDTDGTFKGSDGLSVNIHLGDPLKNNTGYYGGIGQPNDYALKWIDEFLYYYTNYGVRQVLNINPGTVMLGYLLYKLGINIQFKISVYMGNDNPFSILWTLMTAKLFSREDGTTPLFGFNFANTINDETFKLSAEVRKNLEFEDLILLEHHVTETYYGIVRQPYLRRDQIVRLNEQIKMISAKHEGGEPSVEKTRAYPSDGNDYSKTKSQIKEEGIWEAMGISNLDRLDSLNLTAERLTQNGLSFIAAKNLHSD